MRSPGDMIDCLDLAKQSIRKMAWALKIHVSSGIGGGASEVERESENVIGWIDDAIDRIRSDDTERNGARATLAMRDGFPNNPAM